MRAAVRMGMAAAFALFCTIPPVAAEPAAQPRTEVPIRRVTLSTGAWRYVVQIALAGTVMDAGLDSGSTGLRVIGPLPGVRMDGRRTSYGYNVGTRLDGVMAEAPVSIGEVTGAAPIQAVTGVGCTEEKPHCPAIQVPFSQYGIQGDGLAGEGFKAILGLDMAPADVPNPLLKLGVRRWIIELPRPGDAGPGRLILNPTDQELDGFIRFHLTPKPNPRSPLHDAIPACLLNQQTKATICGQGVLDTGAPGIRVVTERLQAVWPDGTKGLMAFYDGDKPRTSLAFTVGLHSEASRMTTEARDVRMARLFLGVTPYFAYDVLYDADSGEVGLKPRTP